MKAKLLPIAMGAMLAGGMATANADVTVFGHIDLSVDSVDIDGGEDDITMGCTTCSIGFKGSEDLGNGLKAIFKVDFQYDITTRNKKGDTEALFDRDQWVGLKGSNFGSVRVGTISTVWKSHGKILDPLYRTALQGRDHGLQSGFHTGAGEEGEGRATKTFRWDSPSYNGVKIGATYTLDSNETGEDENPIGIGAKYSNGGITAFADYYDNQQNGSAETSGWKVGGKFAVNDQIALMAQYEDFTSGDDTNGGIGGGDDFNIWHVAGSVTMGNNLIYLGYGQGENDSMTNGDYDVWTLAGVHSMSKRTSVYVGFTQADCDGSASYTHVICKSVDGESDQFSLGMKHKF